MPNRNRPSNDANHANGDSVSLVDPPRYSLHSSDSLADLPQRKPFPGKHRSATEKTAPRFFCEVGFERVKTVTVLGGTADNVSFESANVLNLSVKTDSIEGSNTTLKLKPTRFGKPRYIARVNSTGAIIGNGQVVDEFEISPQKMREFKGT